MGQLGAWGSGQLGALLSLAQLGLVRGDSCRHRGDFQGGDSVTVLICFPVWDSAGLGEWSGGVSRDISCLSRGLWRLLAVPAIPTNS